LFPPLVVLAAFCKGTSVIKGASRLINKESNRAIALVEEFGKLGIELSVDNDEMKISGAIIKGGTISSRNDHRIAMAAAIAGLKAKGPVIIENAACVTKSWPGFFDSIKRLGVKMDLNNE
jgi:3-phosphoshikimate 1-carboxyvinyltransferase